MPVKDKKKTLENIKHKDHRARMRHRFHKNGFDGYHDYEVLEFILFYIFRQGDTKPKAKALIEEFGSFSAVLDAPDEKIAAVMGMGKDSAISLKALRHALGFYFDDLAKHKRLQINKMTELIRFLRAKIGDKQNEVMFLILLNANNDVITSKIVGEGTVTQAAAFPRRIVEEALQHKAVNTILAHNHPGGRPLPSEADLYITDEIKKALALVEVNLIEHIILTESEYFSFMRKNLI
jgi:DNA repair protein RadC